MHPGSIPCSGKVRIQYDCFNAMRTYGRGIKIWKDHLLSCIYVEISKGGKVTQYKKEILSREYLVCILGDIYTLRSCLQAMPHTKVIQVRFETMWFRQTIPTSQKLYAMNSKSHVDLISNLQAPHVVLENPHLPEQSRASA